jgi:tetratricopeptide (TPR) repeat protein
MNGKRLKYLFWIAAVFLLVVLVIASRSAGTACDEIIHYNHSVEVYNYFASGGADQSALRDSEMNLKYYGQSYDNLVTILTRWLKIVDIYTFRNMMSAVMGWLTVLVTALFAISLSGYRTGVIVVFLFAVTPVFVGHSYNNLKDIPFAFAFIAGTFLIYKLLSSPKLKVGTALLLILSFAFCISIRAGGLILICYLYFFLFLKFVTVYYRERSINLRDIALKTTVVTLISVAAFFLSSLFLWPYALQDPLKNIVESYRIMADYPVTFQQIFEGKVEWSDHMPWYYLLKTMAITIPLVVFAGFILFLVLAKKVIRDSNWLTYFFVVFTVVFPVIFVIIQKSNLYSSWRQFLFVYPGIVLLSASGFNSLLASTNRKNIKFFIAGLGVLLSLHPLLYMIKNHPYEYIYYNELTGGIEGAYAKYELDYYFTSQREASEWLIRHLEKINRTEGIKVRATYRVDWEFRNQPGIQTSWLRYEERSMLDWDYAIIVNRYIPPYQLLNGTFPPENAIHVVKAGGVPVCAILERRTTDDLEGYIALKEGRYEASVAHFEKAIESDASDEMIFYNFAGALYRSGKKQQADSILKKGLALSPEKDLILMYLGNIAKSEGRHGEAGTYYERVIAANRKYFDAYVSLAELVGDRDIQRARQLLRECLKMNPRFKPALNALGDTYSKTDPGIAKKYYDMAGTIN